MDIEDLVHQAIKVEKQFKRNVQLRRDTTSLIHQIGKKTEEGEHYIFERSHGYKQR